LEEVPPAGASGSQAWIDGRTKTNVAQKNIYALFFLVVEEYAGSYPHSIDPNLLLLFVDLVLLPADWLLLSALKHMYACNTEIDN